MKEIALFDFDKTITNRDTLLDLALFDVGVFRFIMNLVILIPSFILFYFKIKTNSELKESFISVFWGGVEYIEFESMCKEYCDKRLPNILHSDAVDTINRYLHNGTYVYIVSASSPIWIKPWAEKYGITGVLGTELLSENNKIVGKLKGRNCYGAEKVKRILDAIPNIHNVHVVAFGDSKGDREMLEFADESYYGIFKK